MSDAERSSFTFRLAQVFVLGFVALCVYSLQKQVELIMDRTVVEDVELYLKATRLQQLVLTEEQLLIDEITKAWKNDNYQGPIRPIRVRDWIRQNGTGSLGDTSSR